MVNSIMFWLLHVLLTFLLRLISFIDLSWSDKTKTFTQMLDLVLWNYKWFVLWISHCNAFFLLCKHLLIYFTTSSGYSCYVCCLSDGIMQAWNACITNVNSTKKEEELRGRFDLLRKYAHKFEVQHGIKCFTTHVYTL